MSVLCRFYDQQMIDLLFVATVVVVWYVLKIRQALTRQTKWFLATAIHSATGR